MQTYQIPWRPVYEARTATGWSASAAGLLAISLGSTLAAGPALRGRFTSAQNAKFAGAPWINGVVLNDEDTLDVPLDHMKGQTAVFGTTAAGKCLRPSALVHTPTGWTRNDALRVGDRVSTPDGGSAAVLGVFPQPKQDWFALTFADGRVVSAGAEHLWAVWKRGWIGGQRIFDTAALQTLLAGRAATYDGLYVRLAKPVEMPEQAHVIPPYVLGVLLGDGSLAHGSIHYTKGEMSVAEAMAAELEGTPWQLSKCYSDGLSRGINKRSPDSASIVGEIKKLGLRGTYAWTKFVPQLYLAGSAAQRLAILQGLLDTDGTVIQAGSVSFVSTSKQLAQDVQELVWSLGGSASIASVQSSHVHKGVRVQKRPAYRVGIRFKSPKMLFRHALKKARAPESNQYSANFKLRIEKVENVGRESGICIAVDHPDHLYICAEPTETQGRQYIVTHNTRMAEVLTAQAPTSCC